MDVPFSRRHGHRPAAQEITIRNDAPDDLRVALLHIATEVGMQPKDLREVVCRVLRKMPDPNNWSDYPNVWDEVQGLMLECEWLKVYDVAEAINDQISLRLGGLHEEFTSRLNDYFLETGIGWQMVEGRIQTRGPESFEVVVDQAKENLEATSRPTAKSELHEALQDLSRRPDPDLTGAVQHAMAALECVARDVSGDQRATLGDLMKRQREKLDIPKPLDEVISKAYGYASERGRHIREGRTPSRRDAELIVGIASTIITYLCQNVD